MFVIVPNSISDKIYARLDAEIAKCPKAAPSREALYEDLLSYYDEHGVIPDFGLTPRIQQEAMMEKANAEKKQA